MSREVSLVELIVHELRTPLTIALGSVRQAEADPAAAETALARARRSCERLERVVAEMRDFTRILESSDVALVPARLDTAIQTAASAVRTEHPVAIETSNVLPVTVVAAQGRLEATLGVLLRALARAARPGEGLVVSAGESAGRATLDARLTSAGSTTSATFDAEWLGGLGFALPLARAVVERSGGRITSVVTRDGRLGAITVDLAAAPTAPPP